MDNLDWKGASAWLSEKTGSKLTGVSKYHLKEGTGKSSRYNIEAWLGPGLMVKELVEIYN